MKKILQTWNKEKLPLITNSYYIYCNPELNSALCKTIYSEQAKLKNYPLFAKLLSETWIVKPHHDTSYATQGLGHFGEYTLMTSYDKNEKSNSKIDIVDSEGKAKTLYFDNKGHVGGVGSHKESGKIYVGNDEFLYIYNNKTMANAENGDVLNADCKIDIREYLPKADYITVTNNYLYLGYFAETDKEDAKLVRFGLDKYGNLDKTNVVEYKDIPYNKVQGMAVYECNNEEYYFFSCSYGRGNKSTLVVAKFDENTNNFKTLGVMPMLHMSEGISINPQGELAISYESDCLNYQKGGKSNVSNILHIDAEKTINYFEELYISNASIKERIGLIPNQDALYAAETTNNSNNNEFTI